MNWRTIGTIFSAVTLASCSAPADLSRAEAGVEAFHKQYNASRFSDIYASSAPDMRKTSQAEFEKFLGAVRRKLGAYRAGKTVGWNVNVGTGGRVITLNREATFERGSATEQFVYQGSAENTKLAGYHITQPRW